MPQRAGQDMLTCPMQGGPLLRVLRGQNEKSGRVLSAFYSILIMFNFRMPLTLGAFLALPSSLLILSPSQGFPALL